MRKLPLLPQPLLVQLSEYIAASMGLYYPPERWYDLSTRITLAAQEFGYLDAAECIQWLVSAPINNRQIEILAHHLTIGETFFFRDKNVFQALKEEILPALFFSCRKAGRALTIWSAGCCTGEEPYSLAILLTELFPHLHAQQVNIIATDINSSFLKKAAAGSYNEWSFREMPLTLKEKYFNKKRNG
jgi:chemotaxis protein methyltransferase CheR